MNLASMGLASACLASALLVVGVSWECRQLAGQLMEAELREQSLQTGWGQLLLEEAALGALPRVEQLAVERLSMHPPAAESLLVVER